MENPNRKYTRSEHKIAVSSSCTLLSNLSNRSNTKKTILPSSSSSSSLINSTKTNADTKKILFKTPSKTPLNLNSAKKKTPNAGIINDRYIPNRKISNMEASYHLMHNKENSSNLDSSNDPNVANEYENVMSKIKRKLIIDNCNGISSKTKVLSLHAKPVDPLEVDSNLKMLYNSAISNSKKIKVMSRHIQTTPDRILDAPDFRNDYYLNLMDWSSTNILTVALNRDIYLWNATSGDISLLFSMDDRPQVYRQTDYVCSLSWIGNETNILAVGYSNNLIELWDVGRQSVVRTMRSAYERIPCLAWNRHILSSGSRAGYINNHDSRVDNHCVAIYDLHNQEVCGIKWSSDGRYLASGANDNLVCIWDGIAGYQQTPIHTFRDHIAAVKAVAWCPWQSNILATGGGTADGHIKIWNTNNGNLLHDQDAKSQISCLLWSEHYKEIVASHGFILNQISLWKYPDMTRMCDLSGHTNRVLQMSMSPDQETIASVSADETIRLWKCFPIDKRPKEASSAAPKTISHNPLTRCIR